VANILLSFLAYLLSGEGQISVFTPKFILQLLSLRPPYNGGSLSFLVLWLDVC
jgi:hypothetical protein